MANETQLTIKIPETFVVPYLENALYDIYFSGTCTFGGYTNKINIFGKNLLLVALQKYVELHRHFTTQSFPITKKKNKESYTLLFGIGSGIKKKKISRYANRSVIYSYIRREPGESMICIIILCL